MGRPLLSEDAVPFIWRRPDCARRRQVLREERAGFAVVAFAIFHPGYGPDNLTPFARVLGSL